MKWLSEVCTQYLQLSVLTIFSKPACFILFCKTFQEYLEISLKSQFHNNKWKMNIHKKCNFIFSCCLYKILSTKDSVPGCACVRGCVCVCVCACVCVEVIYCKRKFIKYLQIQILFGRSSSNQLTNSTKKPTFPELSLL